MIAAAEAGAWFLSKFEALLDPMLPGSEQFSLQQRRAIEFSGALVTDRAFMQQRGIFPSTQDPSFVLAPTAPPTKAITTARLKARFSIPNELYLAGWMVVNIALDFSVQPQRLISTRKIWRRIVAVKLQSDFDAAVKDPALGVSIDLTERWHLVWWEDHLTQASLASVGNVFGVDEERVLAERLFAEDS